MNLDWLSELISRVDWPAIGLWSGLVAFTIGLSFLLWTRWGNYHLVAKCVLFSVLAHLVTGLFFATAQVVDNALVAFAGPPRPPLAEPETRLQVSLSSDDAAAGSASGSEMADPASPSGWDQPTDAPKIDSVLPAREAPEQPAALPVDRAEPAPVQDLPKQSPRPEVPVAMREPESPRLDRPTNESQARTEIPNAPAEAARSPEEPTKEVLPDAEPSKMSPAMETGSVARSKPAASPDSPASNEAPPRVPSREPRSDEPPVPDATPPAILSNRPPDATRDDAARPREATGPIATPEPVPSSAAAPARAGEAAIPEPSARVRPDSSAGTNTGRDAPTPSRSRSTGDDGLPLPPTRLSPSVATTRPATSAVPAASAVRPGSSGSPASEREGVRLGTPQIYQNRMSPNRSDVAISRGGSRASEEAVELALDWLARHQAADGHWDADGFLSNCPANDRCTGPAKQARDDCATTGLVLLAFLGAGHTHQSGKYAPQVLAGLNWLSAQQKSNGDLRGTGRMYSHGIATLALSESLGMTGDTRLRGPVERAVRFTVVAQNPNSGGWRYNPGQYGDTSIFGWQLMSLKSAALAGVAVPDTTWQKARGWLALVGSGKHGGLAAYVPGEAPTPAMTAEALFCRQFLGAQPGDPAVREAADYLMGYLPHPSRQNLYYWYYGTVASFQMGGSHWQRWNAALRDALVVEQRREGHAAGSWDPDGDPWGIEGGRLYTTALATLCLEVYYRFLPLQSLGSEDATGSGRSSPAPAAQPFRRDVRRSE